MTQSAEELCTAIYAETRTFYAEKAQQLGEGAYGFRILYGPPIIRAPILFVGYQPGGGAESADKGMRDGEHQTWPARCDYAVAPWKLAVRLREIWGTSLLERCTGLNAIFFRAPNDAWLPEQPHLRREIEAFCYTRAERIVRTLAPQRIVVIGFKTFDRLATGTTDLFGERNQRLIVRGEVWGVPAYGIVHISGARLSRADQARLSDYFADPIQTDTVPAGLPGLRSPAG
jgi:hypothetical protein